MGARSQATLWFGAALIASVLLASPRALAQSDEERAAARVAAQRGILAFLEGRYDEGVNLLQRAESIVHAPTHVLYLARASEKQGKLVRAREAYLKLVNEELAPNAPKAFREAKAAAVEEANALEARIAHVTVGFSGADAPDVTIYEDDTPLPAASLGIPRPVDPGAHTYRAEAPGVVPATITVIVTEGDEETVLLPIQRRRAVASASIVEAAPASGAPDAGDGLRRFGYVAVGASSLGLAAGIYLVVQAGKEQSTADRRFDRCKARGCEEDDIAAVRRADSSAAKQRSGAVLGFAAGGAALAAGISLLVLAPEQEETPAAVGVRPFLTPTSAGLLGRF